MMDMKRRLQAEARIEEWRAYFDNKTDNYPPPPGFGDIELFVNYIDDLKTRRPITPEPFFHLPSLAVGIFVGFIYLQAF